MQVVLLKRLNIVLVFLRQNEAEKLIPVIYLFADSSRLYRGLDALTD